MTVINNYIINVNETNATRRPIGGKQRAVVVKYEN